MTENKMQIDLGHIEQTEIIYLNADNVGFYRVQYSKEMFENILRQLNEEKCIKFGSSLDRFGFVSDTFALVILNQYLKNKIFFSY